MAAWDYPDNMADTGCGAAPPYGREYPAPQPGEDAYEYDPDDPLCEICWGEGELKRAICNIDDNHLCATCGAVQILDQHCTSGQEMALVQALLTELNSITAIRNKGAQR